MYLQLDFLFGGKVPTYWFMYDWKVCVACLSVDDKG